MKDALTPRQGQYLAFIYHYTKVHGRSPAQADIQYFFRVSPPTVHQKILDLEAKGLLARTPGEPRSLRVLLPPEELPELLPFSGPTGTGHPRSGGRRGRGKTVELPSESPALDHLRDPEARAVLRAILDRHRELTGEAQALAQSLLRDVSPGDVADALEKAVLELTLEGFDRYPSSRYDSVNPRRAAWGVLEMEVQPFLADIERRAKAGQVDAALATCAGVVLGLYRVREGKRGELLEYAPDFPSKMACGAVAALRKTLSTLKGQVDPGLTAAALPPTLRDAAPEWADMLERCWRRPV